MALVKALRCHVVADELLSLGLMYFSIIARLEVDTEAFILYYHPGDLDRGFVCEALNVTKLFKISIQNNSQENN